MEAMDGSAKAEVAVEDLKSRQSAISSEPVRKDSQYIISMEHHELQSCLSLKPSLYATIYCWF